MAVKLWRRESDALEPMAVAETTVVSAVTRRTVKDLEKYMFKRRRYSA